MSAHCGPSTVGMRPQAQPRGQRSCAAPCGRSSWSTSTFPSTPNPSSLATSVLSRAANGEVTHVRTEPRPGSSVSGTLRTGARPAVPRSTHGWRPSHCAAQVGAAWSVCSAVGCRAVQMLRLVVPVPLPAVGLCRPSSRRRLRPDTVAFPHGRRRVRDAGLRRSRTSPPLRCATHTNRRSW